MVNKKDWRLLEKFYAVNGETIRHNTLVFDAINFWAWFKQAYLEFEKYSTIPIG